MSGHSTNGRRVPWLLQLCGYAWRAGMMLDRRTWIAKRHRAHFYRDTWHAAAAALDATFEVLPGGSFKITRASASTIVHDNTTRLDDAATYSRALDKPRVLERLRSHGLPTPDYAEYSIDDLAPAQRFLDAHGTCVVKPADGTGAGRGVTTGVETRRQLLAASIRAAGWGPRMLIEQQVSGDNLRLLYLDGRLLDAVRRKPPTLVGDGRSSIARIVARLNGQRTAGGYRTAQAILRHDMDMRRTLARQGLAWHSVPAEGQKVLLKTVINDNLPDDNERIVDVLADDIVEAGRRAADVLGVRLAGVDVITTDIGRPLEEVGGVILEMNTAPGYYFHYLTAHGPCRVAEPILEACLINDGSAEASVRFEQGSRLPTPNLT